MLNLLRWNCLDPNLCGLSLLLKLLELLRCDKTDRFVSCNQLRASRHGGENDVSAQAANICVQASFHNGCRYNTLALQWLIEDRQGDCDPCR